MLVITRQCTQGGCFYTSHVGNKEKQIANVVLLYESIKEFVNSLILADLGQYQMQ